MKRSRAPNFSTAEVTHLLNLIEKYPVIENKKTDGATVKEKHEAWQMLASEYNSQTIFPSRTPENLLACYKNNKKKLKKTHSSDEMTIRAPSLVHTVEEQGGDWSNAAEPMNHTLPDQMGLKQLIGFFKEEKEEDDCTEGTPPASPSYSDPVLENLKRQIEPSEEDEECTEDQQHMEILPIEFPVESSQHIENDKIPDFDKNKQNQDLQQLHIMKKLIDPSLQSEKKGSRKTVTHSFQELAQEKKNLVEAQKELLDLQKQHQQLEIVLIEEKLDFQRKRNKLELDFLKQKYELELNYLKNKK